MEKVLLKYHIMLTLYSTSPPYLFWSPPGQAPPPCPPAGCPTASATMMAPWQSTSMASHQSQSSDPTSMLFNISCSKLWTPCDPAASATTAMPHQSASTASHWSRPWCSLILFSDHHLVKHHLHVHQHDVLQTQWQWRRRGEACPRQVIASGLDALQHEMLQALDSMWRATQQQIWGGKGISSTRNFCPGSERRGGG